MPGMRNSDEWLFRLFNTRIKCKLLDRISVWLTHTGGATFTIGITFAAIVAGLSEKRTPYLIAGGRAFTALAGSHLLMCPFALIPSLRGILLLVSLLGLAMLWLFLDILLCGSCGQLWWAGPVYM